MNISNVQIQKEKNESKGISKKDYILAVWQAPNTAV